MEMENEMAEKMTTVKETLTEELSAHAQLTIEFTGLSSYGQTLDTGIRIDTPEIAILWKDRDKFLKDLAEVFKKYQL